MLLDPRTSKTRLFLKNCVARRLLSGPFAGMQYRGNACCSNLLPKVLGTYEKEIIPQVIPLIKNAECTNVDVGCAEGYYAVGALFLNPRIKVIAFDVDSLARDTCLEVAKRNGVESRLTLKNRCTSDALQEAIRANPVDLIIMDIEGGELGLLTELGGKALAEISLVVEIHERHCPGTGVGIRNAFHQTHQITEIVSRIREPADLDLVFVRTLAQTSSTLTNRILFERDGLMSWFIMKPLRQITNPGASTV